jgi:hypothetical protein
LTALPASVGLYDPFVHAIVDGPYPIYRELRGEQRAAANRDEARWPDADEFVIDGEPERFPGVVVRGISRMEIGRC